MNIDNAKRDIGFRIDPTKPLREVVDDILSTKITRSNVCDGSQKASVWACFNCENQHQLLEGGGVCHIPDTKTLKEIIEDYLGEY